MRSSVLHCNVDMLHSPLISSIAMFAFPLMLTGVLQLLFNAADMIVVGQFVGPTALAAVGSTGSLTALLTCFFMGFSVGTGVVVSRAYGAHDDQSISKGVHTSVLVGIISGIAVGIIGLVFARPMLELMGSPEDVIDQASLYLRIYFLGMPFTMLYNFTAAILRAVGDTKRPLYYLTTAGVANVLMNVFFVTVLKIGVAGVALATALSQVLALYLTVRCLATSDTSIRLELRKMRLDMAVVKEILRIGLPAGLQSTLFSISNVLIQSSVNSFGSTVMAGYSAAGNIENFAYQLNNAMAQSAITFVSANVGANQKWRIRPIMRAVIGINLITGFIVVGAAFAFAAPLLSLYTSDSTVIQYGILRMSIMCLPIPICGAMDDMVGILRGMGYSLMPMIVSLLCACVFRVVWVMTYFAAHRALEVLFISYPISWLMAVTTHYICFRIALRKPEWREALTGRKPVPADND